MDGCDRAWFCDLGDRGELDMSKFYGALGGTAILLPARLIE